jgi:5-methylcytosine-specific restriction endonuclease McrA
MLTSGDRPSESYRRTGNRDARASARNDHPARADRPGIRHGCRTPRTGRRPAHRQPLRSIPIPALEQACETGIMPAKFCLDCGELFTPTPDESSRCGDCGAERTMRINARPKRNTTQRGLGAAHRARAQAVLATAQVCAICGRPPTKQDPLTADHTIPRSQGGGDSPLRAAHRSCNSRAGAQLPRSKRE